MSRFKFLKEPAEKKEITCFYNKTSTLSLTTFYTSPEPPLPGTTCLSKHFQSSGSAPGHPAYLLLRGGSGDSGSVLTAPSSMGQKKPILIPPINTHWQMNLQRTFCGTGSINLFDKLWRHLNRSRRLQPLQMLKRGKCVMPRGQAGAPVWLPGPATSPARSFVTGQTNSCMSQTMHL